MPKAGMYRANSVIYFQGDLSDKIYILQSGTVSLNYSDIENGKEIREIIEKGEFFGVKSALGKYPREENALVLSDAQVLVFTVPEFEVFVQANPRLIVKMLKVFSNQLRRVHKQVENLLEKSEAESPEVGIFGVGGYYLKNRQYSQAKYVFSRYLTYYPAGRLAEQASRYLEMAESNTVKYGDGKGPAPMVVEATRGAALARRNQNAAEDQPAEDEVKTPSPGGGSVGAGSSGEELSGQAKAYYDAVSLFSQEKYKDALVSFKRIADAKADEEYTTKAIYDMGRCLFMLAQYDATIKHFTQFVTAHPKHPDIVDSLYWLGQSYEKKGDAERAKGFYKKIISMETDEDASVRLKAKKSLRALEEAGRG
jgi:CRP-like cAMP-binding protein